MSLWDSCCATEEQSLCIEEVETIIKGTLSASSSGDTVANQASSLTPHKFQVPSREDSVFSALTGVEYSCSSFISSLDEILGVLDEVGRAHSDVTGRTNVLMENCESLLEQQHSLSSIVDALKDIIEPFNRVEEVASSLGIPVDAAGKPTRKISQSYPQFSSHIDPRSTEFRDILARTSYAINFVYRHPEICESDRYLSWLMQVQRRADSLVARSMLELMEGAARACREDQASRDLRKTSAAHTNISREDGVVPLEAMMLYTKFRGLGFRMRELCDMLRCSELAEEKNRGDMDALVMHKHAERRALSSQDFLGRGSGGQATSALGEVLRAYRTMRCELLLPIVKESSLAATVDALKGSGAGGTTSQLSTATPTSLSSGAICSAIRSAYGIIFRTAQLEQQLFLSLFRKTGEGVGSSRATASGVSSPGIEDGGSRGMSSTAGDEGDCEFAEVGEIVSEMSSQISGQLRSLIIRETSVDSLARVILTLTQDVQSQLEGTRLHDVIFDLLADNLNRTASDARERMVHCAGVFLRQEVQMFEPLPSQLAYPDILEKHRARLQEISGDGSDAPAGNAHTMSTTWYPPLKHTLALLSQLYGAISRGVFEDIAGRAVEQCVRSLAAGAVGVRRWKTQLHGDLFLVRHLLILREQLMPFDMNLQVVERTLDFAPTGSALSHLVSNSRSMLRFDATNSFLQMTRDGLPGVHESHVDVKKRMDETLKASCQSLKVSALHFLLGALESFLAKVTAVLGRSIPVYRGNDSGEMEQSGGADANAKAAMSAGGDEVQLPAVDRDNLKKQQFVKADRIQSVLNAAISTCIEAKPVFADMAKLYIENPVTRAVIVKPVLFEVQLARKRMATVVASCVDHGQQRRELENMLNSIAITLREIDC